MLVDPSLLLRYDIRNVVTVAAAVAVSLGVVAQLGRDFLPPFNEGCVHVNVLLPPGTAEKMKAAIEDVRGVVLDIQAQLAPIQNELPPEYFLEYGGQFESQRQAPRMIGLLGLLSLLGKVYVGKLGGHTHPHPH